MELKNIYLMWVGAEHYPTIAAYIKEAAALGISKRLPNANIARTLAAPDTVVFVAHDEGESEVCPDCAGPIENPEHRIADTTVNRAQRHLAKKREVLFDERFAKKVGTVTEADLDADEDIIKLTKSVATAEARVAREQAKLAAVPRFIEVGESTGGHVVIDGERWDYRRYNYWLHQPAKFDPASHSIEEHQCKTCGGKGRLPLGKVFGMFIPAAVEYILKPEDSDKVAEEMKAKGFRVVPSSAVLAEAKRGCGKRKVGGYYAVTDESGTESTRTEEAVKKLVEAGLIKPEGATVNGDFIQFIEPVAIDGTKRFRGIKSWSLDVAVEEEAEMILEALEG